MTIFNKNQRFFNCILTFLLAIAVQFIAASPVRAAELVIDSQPTDFAGQVGDNARFSVIANGDSLHYQWQYCHANGTVWASSSQTGNTTNTVNVPMTEKRVGQKYRCVITDGSGNTLTSQSAEIKIDDSFAITEQPVSVTIAEKQTAVFRVSAIGENVSYQWQYKSTRENAGWKSCSTTTGHETPTISVAAYSYRNGYQYRCVVMSEKGSRITSEPATLIIAYSTAEDLHITSDPEDAAVNTGENAIFRVSAEGTDLAYQWQYKSAKSNSWKNSTSLTQGYNTPELTVVGTSGRNGYQYRCVVTNVSGHSVISKAVILTVTVAETIIIGKQPDCADAIPGENGTFCVTATGNDLTYRWQYCKEAENVWKDSSQPGYNTEVLSVQATIKRNGQKYRCIIKDAYGSQVITDVATLNVYEVDSLPGNDGECSLPIIWGE